MTLPQEISVPDFIENAIIDRLNKMTEESIIERIWQNDYSVWKSTPDEITNRLGWLDIASRMRSQIESINAMISDLRGQGYSQAVLLGMGGSSLAPDVFKYTFGVGDGFLHLYVLDSTDPGAVIELANLLDVKKTVFIVSTKSGGTVETLSFFKYFYNMTLKVVGRESVGDHFIAITDPGSKLEKIAKDYSFRAAFLNDPNIGGRYSALSFFGLIPAAMLGINLQTLIKRTLAAEEACGPSIQPLHENTGALLGALMGEAALTGRDKVTFVLSEKIAHFGDWVEQLIAESMGKEGKGIVPIVGEAIGSPERYSADRLFIQIALGDDDPEGEKLSDLAAAGHPIARLRFVDVYDLGIIMYLFEFATAVAGIVTQIQPFDQPDVEAAKVLAQKAVTAYHVEGRLPDETITLDDGRIKVFDATLAKTPEEALKRFLQQVKERDYISLHAYVKPSPEVDEALNALRVKLRDTYHVATTIGYGPRFLHSTGQLHKGDGGRGLFIRFTADMPEDAPIPDEAGKDFSSMTFGVLKTAQAMGDSQALIERQHRLIRFHLSSDIAGDLHRMLSII